MKQHRRLAAIVAMIAAAGVSHARPTRQNANRDDPVPATPFQSLTAIERGFAVMPTAEPLTLFPQIREQLKDTPAFLRDSKAGINFRSLLSRRVDECRDGGAATWNEAWAAGGSVAFETGRLFNLISGGLVLYTSFPVYAPLDHDGTGSAEARASSSTACSASSTARCISPTPTRSSPAATSTTRRSLARTTTACRPRPSMAIRFTARSATRRAVGRHSATAAATSPR